jgi:hypothetical protein
MGRLRIQESHLPVVGTTRNLALPALVSHSLPVNSAKVNRLPKKRLGAKRNALWCQCRVI